MEVATAGGVVAVAVVVAAAWARDLTGTDIQQGKLSPHMEPAEAEGKLPAVIVLRICCDQFEQKRSCTDHDDRCNES